jgi:O-acetyl-ADP-ribose deacetylase (regulator of RNase III)
VKRFIRVPWAAIELAQGDITDLACDAIVNAANATLLGGGGVDGAIHRAAGPGLSAECRALGGCPTGEARITRGHRLTAKYVIHTVGPRYRDGKRGEPELLRSCYRNCLKLAVENGIRTIAFPAISCGAYGYPLGSAARIALETTAAFLSEHDEISRAVFVLLDHRSFTVYEDLIRQLRNGPIAPAAGAGK